jgi:hypothetical protein
VLNKVIDEAVKKLASGKYEYSCMALSDAWYDIDSSAESLTARLEFQSKYKIRFHAEPWWNSDPTPQSRRAQVNEDLINQGNKEMIRSKIIEGVFRSAAMLISSEQQDYACLAILKACEGIKDRTVFHEALARFRKYFSEHWWYGYNSSDTGRFDFDFHKEARKGRYGALVALAQTQYTRNCVIREAAQRVSTSKPGSDDNFSCLALRNSLGMNSEDLLHIIKVDHHELNSHYSWWNYGGCFDRGVFSPEIQESRRKALMELIPVMSAKEIFTEAARLVRDEGWHYSCHAINEVIGPDYHQRPEWKLKLEYTRRYGDEEWWNQDSNHPDAADHKNARVLALMEMANYVA